MERAARASNDLSHHGMKIVAVDERNSSWEEEHPRFRVYLHHSSTSATSGSTATYDVVGADVLQVIDWAQAQVDGSMTYAIALVHDDPSRGGAGPDTDRGLVWLVGTDGNSTADNADVADAQRRMLARRHDPVGVPAADRLPGEQADQVRPG